MKYRLKIAAIIFATTLLTACFEPSLDGSSMEALDKSIEKMTEELPTKKEKQAFQFAIMEVMFTRSANASAKKLTKKEGVAIILREMDGKTVEDILSMAKH